MSRLFTDDNLMFCVNIVQYLKITESRHYRTSKEHRVEFDFRVIKIVVVN